MTNQEIQNQISESIQLVNELLEKCDVKNIIYIDDRFDIDNQKDLFLGLVNGIKKRRGRKRKLEFVDWNLSGPAFTSHVSRKWEDASTLKRTEYLNKVYEILKDEDYVSISLLDIHFHDKFLKLTPVEWGDKKDQLFRDLNGDEKFLCLFDYELKGVQNGGDLVRDLLNDNNALKVYCGIYSHTFSPEDEQIKKEEWVERLGVNAFYPISKKRLQDEPSISGFCNGLKNVLLVKHVEDLKEKSILLLKESSSKTIERIKRIHPDTFNDIVQKNSYLEGVWEIETLFRLCNIIMDQETKKAIVSEEVRAYFNKSINHIRKIDLTKTINPDKFNSEQINIFEEEEKYYSGDIINKLHYPIRNGDIFKINMKYYILLCQPCNLSIRTNGKRQNGIDQVFMIELGDKENLDGTARLDSTKEYEIKSYDLNSKIIKYAKLSRYITAQLSLLDLVVFNNEGKSEINLNEISLSETIHEPWTKRYKEIKKEYIAYYEVMKSYKTIVGIKNDIDQKNLEKYVKSPKFLNDFKIDGLLSYKPDANKFEFPIQRIRHYKNAYSIDLLQKFMAYLSRTGFDKDFVC